MLNLVKSMQICDKSHMSNIPGIKKPDLICGGYTETKVENFIDLADMKFCFCVENSRQTARVFSLPYSYLDIAKIFIKKLSANLKHKPTIVSWNKQAEIIESVNFLKSLPPDGINNFNYTYETSPMNMTKNESVVKAIKESQVLVIISSETLDPVGTSHFGKFLRKNMSHLRATIGVITERRSNPRTGNMLEPSDIRANKMMPMMFSNSCILMYNTKTAYVMWANGSFAKSLNFVELDLYSTWNNVIQIDLASLSRYKIGDTNDDLRNILLLMGFVSISDGKYLNLNLMLNSEPRIDDLLSLPYETISFYAQMWRDIFYLYKWIKNLRDEYVKKYLSLELEKINIKDIIMKINKGRIYNNLNEDIMNEYLRIRALFLGVDSVDDNNTGGVDLRIIKLNKIVKYIYNENFYRSDRNNIITTSIAKLMIKQNLSSNSDDSIGYVDFFDVPPNIGQTKLWIKYHKGTSENFPSKCKCSMCDEIKIPVVLIKQKLETENYKINSDIFDYFYEKFVCPSCATLLDYTSLCPDGSECLKVLPIVKITYTMYNNLINIYLRYGDLDTYLDSSRRFFYDKLILYNDGIVKTIKENFDQSMCT